MNEQGKEDGVTVSVHEQTQSGVNKAKCSVSVARASWGVPMNHVHRV